MFNNYLPQILICLGMIFTFFGGAIAFHRNRQSTALIKNLGKSNLDLTQKLHNQITGGDSFPILNVSIIKQNNNQLALLTVFNKGKFPLSAVEIYYCDADFMSQNFPNNNGELSVEMLTHYRTISLPSIKENTTTMTQEAVNVQEGKIVRLSVQLSANSGSFAEELLVAKRDGNLFYAYRINTIGEKPKILEEYISPNFPTDTNGKINWIMNR